MFFTDYEKFFKKSIIKMFRNIFIKQRDWNYQSTRVFIT